MSKNDRRPAPGQKHGNAVAFWWSGHQDGPDAVMSIALIGISQQLRTSLLISNKQLLGQTELPHRLVRRTNPAVNHLSVKVSIKEGREETYSIADAGD